MSESLTSAQKIKTKHIRYQSINDMEKILLSLEQHLRQQQIFLNWINNKEELNTEITKLLKSKQKKNKVCFEIKPDKKKYIIDNNGGIIEEITAEDLSNQKKTAETLIIEADFAVLENQSLVFINKKNRFNFNKFKQFIVLLDIHKVLEKLSDLELIVSLLAQGQKNPSNVVDLKMIKTKMSRLVISEEFYIGEPKPKVEDIDVKVMFVDDGITKILSDPNMIETLFCLECGQCASVCPVYRINQQYTPIELVKQIFENPNFTKQDFAKYSTFCGNCNIACPMSIQITDLMINQLSQYYKKNKPMYLNLKHQYYYKRHKMNSLQKSLRRIYFHHFVYNKNRRFQNYLKQQRVLFYNLIVKDKNTNNE